MWWKLYRLRACFFIIVVYLYRFPNFPLQDVYLTQGTRLSVCLNTNCLPFSLCSLLSLEFSPLVSLWLSGPRAACMGSSSLTVVGGVKGQEQAGRGAQQEGELPRQVKRSREDILLICCWDPETDQRRWQVSTTSSSTASTPVNSTLRGASQFSPACRDGWWESIRLISPLRTPRPAAPPQTIQIDWLLGLRAPESRFQRRINLSCSPSLFHSYLFPLFLFYFTRTK